MTHINGLPVLYLKGELLAFKVNGQWWGGKDLLKNARSPWIWSKEFNKDIL